MFEKDGGTWIQQAHLKGPDTGEYTHPDFPFAWTIDDRFGGSIALSGDTLVVGAPGDSSNNSGGEPDNSAPNTGAVYVFSYFNGTWSQNAFLKASNAEGGDYFGIAVAISGETLAVGAPGEDSSATGGDETDNSEKDSGAVYIFQ